jgi:hypothetical protein
MAMEEWVGLIPLQVLKPDGTSAIVWWDATVPLPESFILQPTPDDPTVFNFVTKMEYLK